MATVTPKLRVCFTNNCKKVKFTDCTGLYNDTTNEYGWSNTQVPGGLELSDLVTARVSFAKYGETTPTYTFLLRQGLVDLYPTEATDSFDFDELDWAGDDGIWVVNYVGTVTSGNTFTTYTDTILVTCKARCCINSLWCQYWTSGHPGTKSQALLAESLLSAAESSFVCNSTTAANDIISTIEKICLIAEAESECGGCGG